MDEQDLNRAKVLGNLIQDARRRAGRSLDDCGQVLDISGEELSQAERGEYLLTLPSLEVLAMYLKVPMSYFWGSEPLPEVQAADFAGFVALRHKIIGALLRQARIQAKRSVQEVAAEVDLSSEEIEAYESGSKPIPLFDLERLAKSMGLSLDHFAEGDHGPMAKHEIEQKMQRRFNNLPPEVKAFVAEPINLSYLETAMRLSEMDVNKLRGIAEGILDITF